MIVAVRSGVPHAVRSATDDDRVAAHEDPGLVVVLAGGEEILRMFEGALLIDAVSPIRRVYKAGALLAIAAIEADKPSARSACGRC